VKHRTKLLTDKARVIKPIDSLFFRIRGLIEDARNKAYRSVNTLMVKSYWEIGRMICEEEQQGKERAGYGSFIINHLSKRLSKAYGKGFDDSNLRHMRAFYTGFSIRDAVRRKLSWTHYRLLLKVQEKKARAFYMRETSEANWSTRTLERQINSLSYERSLLSGKSAKKAISTSRSANSKAMEKHAPFIKDPYVLDFLRVKDSNAFRELDLESGLIEKLQEFTLELGKGFCFVRRQYRISTEEGNHFYIDLVFYNYMLRCFLVIDLKTGPLTHQDIGQMDFYVRYFEDQVRQKGDNPTIGLILCTEKSKTIVKYSLLQESKHIYASKYKLYLPTERALKQELEKEREIIEIDKRLKQA
jgi:predicted nuclease of restriction endonuclease-like (RecB) superfamily